MIELPRSNYRDIAHFPDFSHGEDDFARMGLSKIILEVKREEFLKKIAGGLEDDQVELKE